MAKHTKEQLQKLLDFLRAEVLTVPGNEWFAESLGKSLHSPRINEEILLDIYEHCIEKNLEAQAAKFYEGFVIPELKESLIQDFIKMEMWRRRNNLREFCLALYQQVECVVNHIAAQNIMNDVTSALILAPAYVSDLDNIESRTGQYPIAKLVFIKDYLVRARSPLVKQLAVDKFQVVNYFICKRGKLLNSQFNEFVRDTKLLRDIYSLRNQNHRGNSLSEWDEDVDHRVRSNETYYYFQFLAFLATFIQGVNGGYPISEELRRYAKTFIAPDPSIFISGPTIIGKIVLPDDKRKRFK